MSAALRLSNKVGLCAFCLVLLLCAGLAYIYGPNTTVCAEHVEARAGARESAGTGASVPVWVALHDSLLPGVMAHLGRAEGLQALTWVTDGIEPMAGLADMGAAGVTTNAPELCRPLCRGLRETP